MAINKTVIFATTQKKAEKQLDLMAEKIEQFENIIYRTRNIIETSERRYEAHSYNPHVRALRYSVVCIEEELTKDTEKYNHIIMSLRPDVPIGANYDFRNFVFIFK